MGKGTPSFGKHNSAATHTICRRCGNRAYHRRLKHCASCGYGETAKLRRYNWNVKIPAANGQKRRNGRKEHFLRMAPGKHNKKH